MYLFCISCKEIVATIKVPTLVGNNALHYFTLIKMTVARFLSAESFLIENCNGHTK